MKRILIVGNPIAGRGLATKLMWSLSTFIKKKGHDPDLHFSRQRGDIYRTVKNIGNKVDVIAVVGGDGTVNEVLNGLDDPSSVPLLILPAGTANMSAKELELPQDPIVSADLIDSGKIRTLDMGVVNGRRFLLLVSVGIDSMVVRELSQTRNDILGYRGYMVPILKVLQNYKEPDIQITVNDNEVSGKLAIIMNTKNYGGLFTMNAAKSPDSGFFDVCVFSSCAVPDLLRYSMAGLVSEVVKLPDVNCVSGTDIKIRSNELIPVEVDGDHFGTTPIHVRLVNSCVNIIVPA
jgi:YegS/Rv2252/BmrU family lipid kinase